MDNDVFKSYFSVNTNASIYLYMYHLSWYVFYILIYLHSLVLLINVRVCQFKSMHCVRLKLVFDCYIAPRNCCVIKNNNRELYAFFNDNWRVNVDWYFIFLFFKKSVKMINCHDYVWLWFIMTSFFNVIL